MSIGAAALLIVACVAQAGSLSPALAHLAANYARSPQTVHSLVTHPGARPPAFGPRVNATGAVQVYIHYRAGNAPTNVALYGLNATGVLISRPLSVVQAWVPIAKLQAAALLNGVTKVGLPVYAVVKGVAGVRPAADTCNAVQTGLKIDHDGIVAQNVQPVLDEGITGSGVKVGVISDGVDCISSSQAAGYLPNNVWMDSSGIKGSGDEGTAMLEIVHAVAPAATLGFCGPNTTAEFLQCYDDYATWGANIISDDLGFTPVFFLTSFDNAITSFAQNNPSINLTTSAGNSRQGFFQSNYVATTTPSSPGGPPITLSPTYTPAPGQASGRSYNSAMDFGKALGGTSDAAEKVTLGPGNSIYGDLTWDDPQSGPYDDLDLFLLKSDGSVACSPGTSQNCTSTIDQTTGTNPAGEEVVYTNNTSSNQTLYLVAYCFDCSAHGTNPLHIKLYGNMNNGGIFNYVTGGGVAGHAALAAELTMAAAHYDGSGVNSTIESFSDTGPYVYGDWQNGIQTRAKPDITGIDGVTVSGAGGFSSPFYGTSAASPNVASVIALARSAFPNGRSDATGWKELVMSNANSSALTNYTLDTAGTGLVDAQAALAGVDGLITPAITAPSGSPVNVNPNTDVSFQAACNYTGSQTLNYQWSFGGDSGIPNSTKLTPDPVQYANGGIYTVKFTCADQYQSKTAQKTVAVQAAATATDESLSTAYEAGKTGQFTGTGIGGEQVKYEVVQQPAHGTLQANGSASFAYTPDNGYSGTDSFTFDIDNGVMKSNTATVSVTVGAAPPPPPSGGGGAFGLGGLAALFGLAGLLVLRRRR
ncbi:MAG: Ig-like domain-containing protein [Gammaproteobacteria bacterium]